MQRSADLLFCCWGARDVLRRSVRAAPAEEACQAKQATAHPLLWLRLYCRLHVPV